MLISLAIQSTQSQPLKSRFPPEHTFMGARLESTTLMLTGFNGGAAIVTVQSVHRSALDDFPLWHIVQLCH